MPPVCLFLDGPGCAVGCIIFSVLLSAHIGNEDIRIPCVRV